MTDSERLMSVIKWSGFTKNAFGSEIGLDRSVLIYNILNGRIVSNGKIATISKNIATLICNRFPEISRSWLLTGENEMLSGDNDPEYKEKNSEVTYIYLLPLSAIAGKLNDFVVSLKETDCEKIISPIRNADFAMSVAGESMYPEYPSGSQILIKKINEKEFIEWGKVYVLDTSNGSVMKIVTQSEKEGYLHCSSINPDQKRFAPFDIPMSSIFGMYRVMLCMSMK